MLEVRADGLQKAMQAFTAQHPNSACYDVTFFRDGTSITVAFLPRRSSPDGLITSTGPVAGCGRSVGYVIDAQGEIKPAQMGRD